MPITFRTIHSEDSPAIARIIRTVMPEFGCVGEGYSINDEEVDDMYAAYHNDRSLYLVLENERGEVVGGGGIAPLANGDADTCELKKMYFLNSARGQGCGRLLVERLLEVAQKIGYRNCYIETVRQMERATALYQSFGFEPLPAPLGNTGHSSCDLYFLKKLTPEREV